MWRRRNTLSQFTQLASSKFHSHLNIIIQPTSLRLFQISDTHNRYGLITRSSTTAVESSSGSAKLGFSGLDPVRAIGSTVDTTSLGARGFADVARHYGRCYWELSKAKLSMLVVATSGAGYVLGSGSAVDLVGLGYTCMGTMMVAASASTLNQVFEVKNDAMMNRTRRRPLPSGRITIPHAVTWASSVGLAGTALLASKANLLTAGLGASNLFLYAFVYTPLKQIHPVNTWVGAVVGAIPPLMGWAAASGQISSLNGWILPAALYFWQLPHFMALAYLCRDDYVTGGFKMLSFADPSGRRTALVALRNCIYLIPLGYLAYDWGITSGWFCLESTLLALAISGTAVSFLLNRTKATARRMFHASLLYLPVFMSGLMFHRVYNDDQHLLTTENTNDNMVMSHPTTTKQESRNPDKVKHTKGNMVKSRPPVAYASVAPFPFLPVPIYAPS
ncbi:putative UbiA prenyltransferase family [Helianthus anomalus]